MQTPPPPRNVMAPIVAGRSCPMERSLARLGGESKATDGSTNEDDLGPVQGGPPGMGLQGCAFAAAATVNIQNAETMNRADRSLFAMPPIFVARNIALAEPDFICVPEFGTTRVIRTLAQAAILSQLC